MVLLTLDRLRVRWRRLPLAWRRAVVTALALRVATAVGAFVAGGLLPGLAPVSVAPVAGAGFDGWTAASAAEQGVGLLGAGLERFDALWYLAIARDGYPTTATVPHAAAFYPGYPLAVGLLGRALLGAHLVAANLVSLVATAVGLAGVHRLAEQVGFDEDAARRALVAVAVFPTAFFLVAPYSESLFLAASTWALVGALGRRWGVAAVGAAIAGLTRNVGVLLVLPIAVEVWRAWRPEPARRLASVGALAAAPLAAVAVLALGWVRWGVPLAPVQVQSGWQRAFTWPWVTLVDAVRFGTATPGSYATGYHSLDLLVAIPVLAAVVWLVRRGPASLAWYSVAHVAVWLVYPFPSRPLMSTPRFALVVAPVFLALAAWTRRRQAEATWLATSGALLGVHLVLFVGWYYVF